MPALNLKQATEVARRQAKARESQGNPDILMKLESAEAKLQDLKSNMTILGKEAASALASVEDQQQKLTLERLLSMVVWLVTSSIVRSTLFYVPICTSFEKLYCSFLISGWIWTCLPSKSPPNTWSAWRGGWCALVFHILVIVIVFLSNSQFIIIRVN